MYVWVERMDGMDIGWIMTHGYISKSHYMLLRNNKSEEREMV